MQSRGSFALRAAFASMALYFTFWALDWSTFALIFKPMPALCLMAWVAALGTRDGLWIAAGLLFSAFGDVLLGVDLFLPGLVAFLLAHVAYLGAYLGRTRALHVLRLVPVVLYMWPIFKILEPHLGVMRAPVIAYMVVIAAMVWRAAAQIGENHRSPLLPWYATIGAVVFAISDTMVAWHRFVDRDAAVHIPLMLTLLGSGRRRSRRRPSDCG
jgi:alkenylglycerophosphocholine/alkenylglycerophosphoethanolamine hydrolase